MFDAEFQKLASADQTEFARVVNVLLLKSFIVRDMFDTRERAMKINPDYRFLERFYDLVNSYLKYAGWTLDKDVLNGVFTLSNSYESNRLRLDRETSLLLFTLRLVYENEKNQSTQTGESIYMTTPALIKTMLDYGITLSGKKLSGRLIGRGLRFLTTHNIIAKVSGSYDEGNVSFYILPSIIYAVDNAKIVAMAEALEQLKTLEGGETDL
ncbi:MAG TPA: hypothetical protein DCM23_02655 [Firmicutes bacterium]|nr:hypothetical protein [Bacillota bacterium]HAV19472.1 hypothetical protein [Bacillota bacterium]